MGDLHFYPQAFDTEAQLRRPYQSRWLPRNRFQLVSCMVLGGGTIFFLASAASLMLVDHLSGLWAVLACIAADFGGLLLMALLWRKLLSRYRAYGRMRSAWEKQGAPMVLEK